MSNTVATAGATAHPLELGGGTQDGQAAESQETAGVDIAEAAEIMGVAVPTLRKRLQRGTQDGFKSADGTWRVILGKDVQQPIGQNARNAVGRSLGDAGRIPDWGRVAPLDRPVSNQANPSAMIEMLAGEIRDLREEIERNSALLESTQWQIAQINPPGQFQNLHNHTETAIENQLRPVISALMAVLDYLDRERAASRKMPADSPEK